MALLERKSRSFNWVDDDPLLAGGDSGARREDRIGARATRLLQQPAANVSVKSINDDYIQQVQASNVGD